MWLPLLVLAGIFLALRVHRLLLLQSLSWSKNSHFFTLGLLIVENKWPNLLLAVCSYYPGCEIAALKLESIKRNYNCQAPEKGS